MAETVSDSIAIAAPVEDILAVVLDFASYPQWNRDVKEAEVLETDKHGRATLVRYRVDARVRVVGYTLAYDHSELPQRLSWSLTDGDLEDLQGSYAFAARDGITEVTYRLRIEPGFPLPSMLRRRAERRIIDGALAGLKARVEEDRG